MDFGGEQIYHDSHEKNEYNRICSEHMDISMIINTIFSINK